MTDQVHSQSLIETRTMALAMFADHVPCFFETMDPACEKRAALLEAAEILRNNVPDPINTLRVIADAATGSITDAATSIVNALHWDGIGNGALSERSGASTAAQWIDEATEFNVVYLGPQRCTGPCCYRAPQPTVAPETMRQIIQAAVAHPRFTTPAPPPRICFAPPGTHPHDDAFTMIDGISSIRTGGRTARMQAAAADATSAGAHVHRVSTKDGTHCLNGQCQF